MDTPTLTPSRRETRLAIVLCSVLGMLVARPCNAQVATGTVVSVIVNQDNPVENLSLADLRDILSGQKTYWSAGKPVSLIVMPGLGTPERQTVLSVALAMNEAAYKKNWVGRVFRAESASAPITADSSDAVAREVTRVRGAVGLVAQPVPSVRVVRVNGALPGDAGYPLRSSGGSSTAAPVSASIQSVALMFTPAVVQQALSLKGALKVEKLDSFDALNLVRANPEQRRAYADKVAGMTAVIILGEDALKASADVEFAVPVICVNATGATAAKNRIVRVFDGAEAPASAKAVAPGEVAAAMGSGKEVALKGQVGPTVQAVLTALK